MRESAQPSKCFCAAGQEVPRTLASQRMLGPVTPLDGDLEALALLGTQFVDALISTNNGAALISARGGYAAAQSAAKPFRISRDRVNMRIGARAALQLYRADDIQGLSLLAANHRGEITHRIVTRGDYDNRVLRMLPVCQVDSHEPERPLSDNRQNVISITAIRNARETWEKSDTGHHLNDLLYDGGLRRAQTLGHIGRNKAWRVIPKVLPSFMTYLIEKGIGHARLVPGDGHIQGDLAHGGAVSLIGGILLVQSAKQHFAIDLEQVHSVWVTRFGVTSQLELYDQAGRALAVFASDPMSCLARWNELLASLPGAGRNVEKA